MDRGLLAVQFVEVGRSGRYTDSALSRCCHGPCCELRGPVMGSFRLAECLNLLGYSVSGFGPRVLKGDWVWRVVPAPVPSRKKRRRVTNRDQILQQDGGGG